MSERKFSPMSKSGSEVGLKVKQGFYLCFMFLWVLKHRYHSILFKVTNETFLYVFTHCVCYRAVTLSAVKRSALLSSAPTLLQTHISAVRYAKVNNAFTHTYT